MAAAVDVRLIDPTEKGLAAALRRAHAAANRGVTLRIPKLDRDADFWGRFARDCMREPAGRRRSCKAGYQTPEVIAGWWTDPAGRWHVRVVGRTRGRNYGAGRLRGEGELRGLPPWWHVYPESVLAVRQAKGDGETYLACCRCGKVGTPESLGWMGDTCGPCFDRRADGGVPAGGFGHFGGWVSWQARVGFTPDGAGLVGPQLAGKLRVVSRADGAEVVGRNSRGAIVAVAGTPDGYVIALADGAVDRWPGGAAALTRVVPRPRMYGRVLLAPDGRRAVVMSSFVGYTADLTAPRPQYAQVEGLRAFSVLQFAPSGERLLGIAATGELVSLDPATLAETVVRTDVFAGLARYAYAQDMAVAPDGEAVAVVREVYSPPSATVRVIPLSDRRPPYDLPLPAWHRPTALAFAPDGAHLATADTQAGWVGFWKLPSGKSLGFVRAVPEDPGWRGGQLLFSPDGGAVAAVYSGFHQERGSTAAVWPWPDVAHAASG